LARKESWVSFPKGREGEKRYLHVGLKLVTGINFWTGPPQQRGGAAG